MSQIKNAKEAFDRNDFKTSLLLLDEIINQNNFHIEALLLRSSIAQKKQNWSDALNDLNRILEIDEYHVKALTTKVMIMEILKFRNTDLYNP